MNPFIIIFSFRAKEDAIYNKNTSSLKINDLSTFNKCSTILKIKMPPVLSEPAAFQIVPKAAI